MSEERPEPKVRDGRGKVRFEWVPEEAFHEPPEKHAETAKANEERCPGCGGKLTVIRREP